MPGPFINDSATPPVTHFTLKAMLGMLSATRAHLTPMSLQGTPEEEQDSEHQANLDIHELVDEGRVIQPVPLDVDSCHLGIIPMLLRGAPEVRQGSKHQASLKGP